MMILKEHLQEQMEENHAIDICNAFVLLQDFFHFILVIIAKTINAVHLSFTLILRLQPSFLKYLEHDMH